MYQNNDNRRAEHLFWYRERLCHRRRREGPRRRTPRSDPGRGRRV